MASRGKRRLEPYDYNKSDPEDLDFGAPSSPGNRRAKAGKSQAKRPRKRQRRNASDEDISDDGEASSDSLGEEEEGEETLEINPRTGRSIRSAAKKAVKYEEKSEDDISEVEVPLRKSVKKRRHVEDEDKDELASAREPSPVRRLIVKLKPGASVLAKYQSSATLISGPPDTRSRMGSKSVKSAPIPEIAGRRRSSRLSHEDIEPILALTDSGKHVQVVRPGTTTPEPQLERPRRGGKGLQRPATSAILEASQEDSGESLVKEDVLYEQLAEGSQMELEAQVESSDKAPPSDTQMATQAYSQAEGTEEAGEGAVVAESVHDEDEDSEPINPKAARSSGSFRRTAGKRVTRSSQRSKAVEDTSDFEPAVGEAADEEGDVMSSDGSKASPKESPGRNTDDSSRGRRSQRLAGKTRASQRNRRNQPSDHGDSASELDPEELAEEVAELNASKKRKRQASGILYDDRRKFRNRNNRPDYRVFRPELLAPIEDDDEPAAATPSRNRRGGPGYRSLFSTFGPFGGAGGPPPVLGGPGGFGAVGGADPDSSDDDMAARGARGGIGGINGMTPTSAAAQSLYPQFHNFASGQGGPLAAPTGVGRIKDRKALTDADPLGVDQNVTFDGVGGLGDHIDQLKEMIMFPLFYPQVFQQFRITPPRGVLFHGPPGTGKTLLARALANSVSTDGRKVAFYMRKGGDALSKWVGEAEKGLRLLFEEARNNQPSIIFFDEIDGIAPVRSSKQDQMHASIVATLLALMDGLDGRGQVIVIGATNRPDSVDPALRRPGRFDREFYFPLPDLPARRAILDINVKDWDPPLKPQFKDQLAELTKGYGGADLRALCTEAALNAVQRTYPQIYKSDQKLLIDPTTIKIQAKDFMISMSRMIPSSERTVSSGSSPLNKTVEPLLRRTLSEVSQLLDRILPRTKKHSALEEAEYEDHDNSDDFGRETLRQEFETSRIFRPRLLIRGFPGMGQHYVAGALLNKLEQVHVQSFDLPVLLEDSNKSLEAAVVQLFNEVKRRKPSVIYIPNMEIWYERVGSDVVRLFTGLLRGLPATDPVLLLGVMDNYPKEEEEEQRLISDLFSLTSKNVFSLERPNEAERREFFGPLMTHIRTAPSDFPDSENRKRREIPVLQVAPPPPPPPEPTKEEIIKQRKHDKYILNNLKMRLQPIMDMMKKTYKRFRIPPVDDSLITYLFDEVNPEMVSTDVPQSQPGPRTNRPYELDHDDKGVGVLRETATGKTYYNLELVTIEKRLSNGYYKRPKDFLEDIKKLLKDARTTEDVERALKANELFTNVEVDIGDLEMKEPFLMELCEQVYQREQQRAQEQRDKAAQAREEGRSIPPQIQNVPPNVSGTTTDLSGPLVLGEPIPGRPKLPMTPPISGPNPQISGPETRSGPGTTYGITHMMPGVSVLSNGTPTSEENHPKSNGSTVPSRAEGDVHMAFGADTSGLAPVQPSSHPKAPVGPTQSQRLSQRTAITPIAQGSHIAEYRNDASTTTSGKKTSDPKSKPSVGKTPSSNGVYKDSDNPDFPHVPPPGSGATNYPDTQEMGVPFDPSPQDGGAASQAMSHVAYSEASQDSSPKNSSPNDPPPNNSSGKESSPKGYSPKDMPPPSTVPRRANIHDTSKNGSERPTRSAHGTSQPAVAAVAHPPTPRSDPQPIAAHPFPFDPVRQSLRSQASHQTQQGPPKLFIDSFFLETLHALFVEKSSGLSVEQLVQVNAAMLDTVWEMRGEWNKTLVADAVQKTFTTEVEDIEQCQGIGLPSQEVKS